VSIVPRLLEGWEKTKCPGCGDDYMRRPDSPVSECPTCQADQVEAMRVAGEAAHLLAAVPSLVDRLLRRAGVSTRERTARLELIPAQIRRLIDAEALGVSRIMAGEPPRRGFGLSGGAGCGKTFALVAVFRAAVEARLRAQAPTVGRRALAPWFAWASWPEEVNRLRVVSTADDGLARAHERVEALAAVEALVLDDVGVERMRGGYEDDWATSQLDALVDARYNEVRPTWFTTNLTAEEFQARYGSRVFSRLCGENPLLLVPGPDLRMVRR